MKRFIFFVAVVMMMCGTVNAGINYYDFTQTTAEGQELAYIIDSDSTVFVGAPGKSPVTIDTIIVPSSVTYLGDTYTVIGLADQAFSFCTDVKRVILPESLTIIGMDAFESCYSIDSIIVPDAVTDIRGNAFSDCIAMEVLVIGKGVTNMGSNMILGTNSLTKVNYTGTVDQWNDIVFGGGSCNPIGKLHQLYINDTLLTDLVFESAANVTNAFSGCWGIQSITFAKNTTSIANSAFKNCTGLLSLYLGDSVISVGAYAFQNCTSLKTVTIASSVQTIGNFAFSGCAGLEEVTFLRTEPPVFSSNIFSSAQSGVQINVPCGALESYTSKLPSSFTNIVEGGQTPAYSVESDNKSQGTVMIMQEPVCPDFGMVFKAIPNTGYHFSVWSDGDSTNPRVLLLTQDTALIAYFEANVYSVTALSNNADYGTVEGGGTAKYLDTVVLTAIPGNNCDFVWWDDGNTNNPRTIVVTQDTVLTALFAPVTDGIDGVEHGGVTVSVIDRQIVVAGADGVRKEIFDVCGRRLYSSICGVGTYTVPAPGMYLLHVGESKTIRIMVL